MSRFNSHPPGTTSLPAAATASQWIGKGVNGSSSNLNSLVATAEGNSLTAVRDIYLKQGYDGEQLQALEKVLFFDIQEPFAARLYDSFILSELPRAEVKHCVLEEAVRGVEALVLTLPELRRSDSPFILAINTFICRCYQQAGQQIPTDWLSQKLKQEYLENSFDNTLPVNTVLTLPFGPDPSVLKGQGLPSYLLGVSIWRLPFFRDFAIKDAMRAVLSKVSSFNHQKPSVPIRSIAVPTFYTAMVDEIFEKDAKSPAWQMATAYYEYCLARDVPNTPRNLTRIEDPLLEILNRGQDFSEAHLESRGLVNKRELSELLSYATGEKGNEKTKAAALRYLQTLLRRKEKPFIQRPFSETILDEIASKTITQLKQTEANPASTSTFSFLFGRSGGEEKANTCLERLLSEVMNPNGTFQPWRTVEESEFEERCVIAAGGGGVVKEVVRLSDGRRLVKKEFTLHGTPKEITDRAANQDLIIYARSEVAFMSLLKNEHLVNAVGANLNVPNQFVVMLQADLDLFKLIHNTPLDMHARKPVSFKAKLRIARHIARGMAELHRVGVVHRDLKSLNVLLSWTDDGWLARVSDFGTTRVQNKQMTRNIGTPDWMAPEVAKTNKYTKEVDVYSFGVVLWEIWSFQPPEKVGQLFQQDSPMRGEIAELARKCLSRNPAARPSFSKLSCTMLDECRES